jgi:hypothetical protein
LTLGRCKGVVNDANLEQMRTIVAQNPDFANLSWSALADMKVETAPVVPTAQTATLAAALRAEGVKGTGVADERNCWTVSEWRKKDPKGLLALETSDPAKFSELVATMVKTGYAVA